MCYKRVIICVLGSSYPQADKTPGVNQFGTNLTTEMVFVV